VLDLPLVPVLWATENADRALEWPQELRLASAVVVENNPLTRSILAASLKPHFSRVDTMAADGADIPRGAYHHVIVDHASAGKRGCESVARLALCEGQKAIVTLLSSAVLDPQEHALWIRYGVTQVLQRPLSVQSLVTALQAAHEEAFNQGLPPLSADVAAAA
jgi:DNA-binding response OmpR family regulator